MSAEITNDEIRSQVAQALGWVLSPAGFEDYALIDGINYAIHKDTILAIKDGRLTLPDRLPNCPENIAAAWPLAVEAKITIIPVVNYKSDQITGYLACAEIYMHEKLYYNGDWFERSLTDWYYADTAPRAICLAYLQFKQKGV